MIGVRRLMHKLHVDATALGFPGLIRRIITIFRREKFSHYYIIAPRLESARCFEIGGPSPIFKKDGAVPVYADAEVVDGSNFSSQTMWQGNNSSCRTYSYDPSKSAGRCFLLEATNLSEIASGIYDCVLSSHVIEHVANPFKALREWGRVLKENGILILVIPHRDGTFDYRRPLTTLHHLIQDETSDTGEADTTHLQEFLDRIDLQLTHYGDDVGAFRKATVENYRMRGVHHHVFDTRLAIQMTEACGFSILAVESLLPNNIVIAAEKSFNKGGLFLDTQSACLLHSPFRTDRMILK